MLWRKLLGRPLKQLDTPAWRAIFGRGIVPYSCGLPCLATKMPSRGPFTILNVKKIYTCFNCWEKYVGIFQLKDGRYVCLRGNYCEQDGVAYSIEAQVSCFLKEIIRFALTERERRQLNLLLPDDPGGE